MTNILCTQDKCYKLEGDIDSSFLGRDLSNQEVENLLKFPHEIVIDKFEVNKLKGDLEKKYNVVINKELIETK